MVRSLSMLMFSLVVYRLRSRMTFPRLAPASRLGLGRSARRILFARLWLTYQLLANAVEDLFPAPTHGYHGCDSLSFLVNRLISCRWLLTLLTRAA